MIDLPPSTEIVVTARALPAGKGEASQGEVVLGRDALERAAGQGLDQLIRSVPGVQLFRRSDSRSANPTTQGVTLRGLGGNAASRALVLLDGVPQSDPFGGWINWPALDPAGLAEVRIVRGGGSVLWGPGALAGTIELSSDRSNGVRASLEGRLDGAGEARMSGVAGGLSLAAWGGEDQGFVPIVREDRGPIDRRSPISFGGVRASGRTGPFELGGSLFADRRERGLPLTGNASRGADLFARWKAGERASLLLYHQVRRLENDSASASANRTLVTANLRQRVPAKATGWSGEVRPLRGKLELRLGGDGRWAEGRSDELASFVAGAPTRERRAAGSQTTVGLFADAAVEVGSATLSAGVRADRWWLRELALEERNLASGVLLLSQRSANRSGWAPTARSGVRLRWSPDLTLRAAAYLGWRLPTLNELVRPFRVGPDAVAANAALEPERLRGIEGGFEWERGPWQASATMFANRTVDPIVNVTRGSGPGVFPGVGFVAGTFRRRENVGAIVSHGVETSLGWRMGDWRANGGLSFVSARVRDDGPLDGLRPAQVPRWSMTTEIGWRTLALQLRHVGAQSEDDLGTLRLPAATTLDASAEWPLRPNLFIRMRGENLTNTRVLAARSGDGIDERATPRRLWIGLRLAR